jgi:hypothetical protein
MNNSALNALFENDAAHAIFYAIGYAVTVLGLVALIGWLLWQAITPFGWFKPVKEHLAIQVYKRGPTIQFISRRRGNSGINVLAYARLSSRGIIEWTDLEPILETKASKLKVGWRIVVRVDEGYGVATIVLISGEKATYHRDPVSDPNALDRAIFPVKPILIDALPSRIRTPA